MNDSLLLRPISPRRALTVALLPAALVGLVLACGKSEPDPSNDVADSGANDVATDANPEAGSRRRDSGGFTPDPCPPKRSECIDDDTMRVYARDGFDAGVCVWVAQDVPCDDVGFTPRCQDGKCRVVVLR